MMAQPILLYVGLRLGFTRVYGTVGFVIRRSRLCYHGARSSLSDEAYQVPLISKVPYIARRDDCLLPGML